MIVLVSGKKLGKSNVNMAKEYLSQASQDKIKAHELHSDFNIKFGEFQHSDGWGGLWLQNGKLKQYKSIKPFWKSKIPAEIEEQWQHSSLLVLHARKSSPGKQVNLKNVHPYMMKFNGYETALVHNGTLDLHRISFDESFTPDSPDSDTERLFYHFLTQIKNNPESKIRQLLGKVPANLGENFSANYFFLFGNKIYASVNYAGSSARPNYLTMQYIKQNSLTVVASEAIEELGRKWVGLKNGDILEIPITNFHNN